MQQQQQRASAIWLAASALPLIAFVLLFDHVILHHVLSSPTEEITTYPPLEPYHHRRIHFRDNNKNNSDGDGDDNNSFSLERLAIKKHFHRQQMKRQVVTNDRLGRAFFQRNWEPSYTCDVHARMGSPGDGGKWVCDPQRFLTMPDCIVYSVGSNDEFSFEEEVHNFNPSCQIHTFDSEPLSENSKKPPFVHFHAWSIGGKSSNSIKAIMGKLQHDHISVLKIDCEGCEFEALLLAVKPKISQILVEVHFDENPAEVHALFRFLSSQGYAIFSKEPNIQYSTHGNAVEFSLVYVGRDFF